VFAHPAVGRFLKEAVFHHGARYRWDKLIERAVGEPLTPRYFVEEFAGG
jgi:peptidyl-dipeptidase A